MNTVVRMLLVGGLILSGCSNPESNTPEPAPSGVRSIEIEANDALRFDPDELSVTEGERVRFVLTNTGVEEHEFVLGDEEVQAAHGSDDHGGHGAEALADVALPPGATEEVTVTFDDAGELHYGCHVGGHYAAGMVGTLTVTAA